MTDIYIYDEIGFFGTTAEFFKDKLPKNKSEAVTVHLNSPGGSVFEGVAIYNLLKGYEDVSIVVEGLAASIATVIAMAGKVKMLTGSLFMIHNPWGMAVGGSDDMKKEAEVLDKIKTSIIDIYLKKSGLSEEKLDSLMSEETWLTPGEAMDLGFIDEIEEAPAIAAKFDLSKYGFLNSTKYHKGEKMEKEQKNEVTEEVTETVEQPGNVEQVEETNEVVPPADLVEEATAEEVTTEEVVEEVVEENKVSFTPEELDAHNKKILSDENNRQSQIREMAFAGQEKLVDKLISEGTTPEKAVFQINSDYKNKIATGEVKNQGNKELNDFENAAPDAELEGEGEIKLSIIDQYKAIKNPVERQKFYRAHRLELTKSL